MFLEIAFDRVLGFEKLIEGSVQAIFGHRAVGNTEEVFEARGSVPFLCECEFRARRASAVDHLDGHDISGADRLLALGNVPVEDLVELEELSEPERQPNITELAWVGPTDGFQVDPDDICVVERGGALVVWEETELTVLALLIVESDDALPAKFLVVVEFSQGSDDALSRSGLDANAFDDSVVGVGLAVLCRR